MSILCAGIVNLNPITGCRLYKSIVLLIALFGCELWSNRSKVECDMLERFQRFCAKGIQHLTRMARSDICCPMLGLHTLNGYINGVKLNFMRRLLALPNECVSKQIFLRRWFQCKLENDHTGNFCCDLFSILQKYNLNEYVESYMFGECYPPQKKIWKTIYKHAINNFELNSFEARTESHDLDIFKSIHCDISDFNYLWYMSKQFPHLSDKCFLIAAYLVEPANDMELLCEFCGRFYSDKVLHSVTICDLYIMLRDSFWAEIINSFPCAFSAHIYNLEDLELLKCMLGAPLENVPITAHEYVYFLVLSVNVISQTLTLS